ncbi:DUF6294 family protein [Bacillus cereus]|uniref:DUF6294 family protein n=1 Tax=Bacillus cereus TaxID=1396 RepID=UPI000BFEA96C|nr:DUF6294 family protein [Bacillus cereus]MEB9612276.1 DUF6294 family protein [Bacillus cereus]PGU11081.1 hypothetical protein COD21_12220 [Bacillus cereus]
MRKSNNTEHNYTEPEGVVKQNLKLELLSAKSSPIDSAPPKTLDLRQFTLFWPGTYSHGHCTIYNMQITLFSDGRADFKAYCSTGSAGDCWVFYDGISLHDNHNVELFRSGKLIGPDMEWTGSDYTWTVEFFYPAMWFDSIASAVARGMHC